MGRLLGFAFWSLLILGSESGVTVCIVFLILFWSIALDNLRVFLGLVCCWNLLLGSIDVHVCTRRFLLANLSSPWLEGLK
jgi:hypothetical protein